MIFNEDTLSESLLICPYCKRGDQLSADAEPNSYLCYRCWEHSIIRNPAKHNGETINELTALVERVEKNSKPLICACCEQPFYEFTVTSDSLLGLVFCSTECRDFTEMEAKDAERPGIEERYR